MGNVYSHYKDMERQMFENAHNQTMQNMDMMQSQLQMQVDMDRQQAFQGLGSTLTQGLTDAAKDFFLR